MFFFPLQSNLPLVSLSSVGKFQKLKTFLRHFSNTLHKRPPDRGYRGSLTGRTI